MSVARVTEIGGAKVDLNLYAKFDAPKFNIICNTNGGYVSLFSTHMELPPATYSALEDEDFILPEKLDKSDDMSVPNLYPQLVQLLHKFESQ